MTRDELKFLAQALAFSIAAAVLITSAAFLAARLLFGLAG